MSDRGVLAGGVLILALLLMGASYTQQALIPGGAIVDEQGNIQRATPASTNWTTSGRQIVVATRPDSNTHDIRVVSAICVAGGTTTVTFEDSGIPLSAGFPLSAGQPLVLPFNPLGWFTTQTNGAISINNSGATSLGCTLLWQPF